VAGGTEPDDQLTAERRHGTATAAPTGRSWARAVLVLCALAVVASAAAAAWWLGTVAAFGVYVAGTLALVAVLLVLARNPGRR